MNQREEREERRTEERVGHGRSSGLATGSFLVLVATVGWLSAAPSLDPAAAFEEAARFYEQGEYAAAVNAYSAIIDSGHASAPLYFNRGNACFKAGSLGRAIWNYRVAERLDPRDPDVRANLAFARSHVTGALSIRPGRLERFTRHATLNEWILVAAAGVWLWLGLLILGQLRPAWRRGLRGLTALTALLAALLVALGAVAWISQNRTRTAIVIGREITVRYGPLAESQTHYTARDGSELEVLDVKEDWVQVADRSRRPGWVRTDEVLLFPPRGVRRLDDPRPAKAAHGRSPSWFRQAGIVGCAAKRTVPNGLARVYEYWRDPFESRRRDGAGIAPGQPQRGRLGLTRRWAGLTSALISPTSPGLKKHCYLRMV